jgi:imidazolonepropionase-like amidohydrolase
VMSEDQAVAVRRAAEPIPAGAHIVDMPGPRSCPALHPAIASRLDDLITTRRRLHQSGALVVAGSDAGVTPVKPHDVLRFGPVELWGEIGMSPAEALWAVTSTSRAAQVWRVGHRKGRIGAGFDADILAIDGNPLEDVAAIRKVRAIYARDRPVITPPGHPGSVDALMVGVPLSAGGDRGTADPQVRGRVEHVSGMPAACLGGLFMPEKV